MMAASVQRPFCLRAACPFPSTSTFGTLLATGVSLFTTYTPARTLLQSFESRSFHRVGSRAPADLMLYLKMNHASLLFFRGNHQLQINALHLAAVIHLFSFSRFRCLQLMLNLTTCPLNHRVSGVTTCDRLMRLGFPLVRLTLR